MPVYQLRTEQVLPCGTDELWQFISTPLNLRVITPDAMKFEVISEVPDTIYTGLMIEYRVSPFPGYRTKWLTEITHVDPGRYFIDEQRVGPYRIWHHEHHIAEHSSGTHMLDIVTYQPPLGFIGAIANTMFIRSQLARIFAYREQALIKHFGSF